jgi:predicted nucleotidyltransferase
VLEPQLEQAVATLRSSGARFVYLHGSRAVGTERPDSDFDVAAAFGPNKVDEIALQAALPPHVDLLLLENCPLELAGRVAMNGRLLFEADRAERVAWEATTRKIFLDELPRLQRAAADFKMGAIARGRR